MSKEKQIEELAWDLCDIPRHPSIKSCDECGSKHCHAIYYAERAINKGYRKQSEGTWMTHHCTNGGHSQKGRTIIYKTYTCDACGTSNGRRKTNFCPNCGAKMKG